MTTRFEPEHFDSELEAAFEAIAARIPHDVYEHLEAHRYRSRSRLVRRTAIVGAPIAAASAAVAVLMTGFGPTTQVAFAGWTAAPTTPSVGQVPSAKKRCLATASAVLQSEQSMEVQQKLLGTPEGGFRPVVVDSRGPYTLVVMSITGTVGREEAACLTGPGILAAHPQLVTATGKPPPPLAPGAVGSAGWGSGGTSGARQANDTVLLGTVGAAVSTVTLTLRNGNAITASVANGLYAAWWPGSAHPATAVARTETGTMTTHSFGPGPGGPKLKTPIHISVTPQS